MEPADVPEALDEMNEWDAIEDLQNQVDELEKKYKQLQTSLWAAFGSLIALLFILVVRNQNRDDEPEGKPRCASFEAPGWMFTLSLFS
jgi:hypothetical protein